jgi:hypothetical protein
VTAALARRERGDETLMEIARSYAVSDSTISRLLLLRVAIAADHALAGAPRSALRPRADMVLTDAEKAENNRIAVCCSRSKSRVIVLDI